MIMERTSRLVAAREQQKQYAAALDAQVQAKKRMAGNFAAQRGRNFEGRAYVRRRDAVGGVVRASQAWMLDRVADYMLVCVVFAVCAFASPCLRAQHACLPDRCSCPYVCARVRRFRVSVAGSNAASTVVTPDSYQRVKRHRSGRTQCPLRRSTCLLTPDSLRSHIRRLAWDTTTPRFAWA